MHVDFCTPGSGAMYNRSLAAFLVGASEYAYYACTDGWSFQKGERPYSRAISRRGNFQRVFWTHAAAATSPSLEPTT